MEEVSCLICGNGPVKQLFTKESRQGEAFLLNRCRKCGLEFLSPRPTAEEIGAYYRADYFTRRTDRGYDDYFSEKVRREIERVFTLNLADLGFFEFEAALEAKRRSLDIGCAAGYFVSYLKERGWDARGIDISAECVEAARSQGLDVFCGDYLRRNYETKFDLITLWASIEHLHQPHVFLDRIRDDLDEHGRLYISTCRTGGLNFMRLFGKEWRFYNFPEHLYFFSRSTIKKILVRSGFRMVRYETYGSGFGGAGTFVRSCADRMAKKFHLGDMMLIAAEKE